MHSRDFRFLPALRFHPDTPPFTPDSAGDSPDPTRRTTLFSTPILIVEDESMIAWMIEDILLAAGFTAVAMAPDGDSALAEAARTPPGLIVSDVNLGPGADGIATARTIIAARAAAGTSSPGVIFITGYADDMMRQRLSAELPAAQLLRKPVEPNALTRAVMRALAS
ncbi:MAG: response regulator [Sphingomicrobium sp.]|nr:response regulator [Sphingomonadales bacterium]